jgi:cold shock protein
VSAYNHFKIIISIFNFMKLDKKSCKFGLHPSLIIPIAAKTVDAIKEYVGDVEVIVSGSKNAFVVTFEPLAPPNELEIWKNSRSYLLQTTRQLWVDVDDRNYRKLYKNTFPEIDLTGFDVDHIFNKQLAKMYGFQFVRLLHVSVKSNREIGSGPEKESTSFRKKDYVPVHYEIQYADPLDMCKLMHLKTGTGQYMDAIANFPLFYGVNKEKLKSGIVKFYNPNKGFGTIKTDEGQELFFHITNVNEGTNPESLEEGARVSFEEGLGKKGPQAESVSLKGVNSC